VIRLGEAAGAGKLLPYTDTVVALVADRSGDGASAGTVISAEDAGSARSELMKKPLHKL
jgi:hypothetical protein